MKNIRKDGAGRAMAEFEDETGQTVNRYLTDDELKTVKKSEIKEYGDYIEYRNQEVSNKNENKQAIQYLEDTDWYVIRNHETGKAIPQEILDKRAEAREKIK